MTQSLPEWIQNQPAGMVLKLLIQPKASKTEVVGPYGEPARLKIRVAAPPVDGQANLELIHFLSKKLGIPKSRISILRGETGKTKDIYCEGLSFEGTDPWLVLR